MEQLIEAMAGNIVIVVVGAVFVVGMTLAAIKTVFTTFARERTRREIAAYIAEGSITPEQGERLIRADVGDRKA